jgi:hypothetical protein
MSKKNEVRHLANCQITTKATVTLAEDKKSAMPSQNRKEEAKKILYLNRI